MDFEDEYEDLDKDVGDENARNEIDKDLSISIENVVASASLDQKNRPSSHYESIQER